VNWRIPLAVLVCAVALVPIAAVAELPGEEPVKDLLGVGQTEPCGPIVNEGEPGVWRSEPQTPTLRDGPSGARVGSHAYLVGGIADFSDDGTTADSLATVERFDFRTGRYEELPPLPRELNHVALAEWEGDVYAVGGLEDDLEQYVATGDAWRYRVDERRWEPIAPMPTPRGAAGAAVIGDKLYVVGGLADRNRLRTLEAYDLRTGRWEQLEPMRVERDHLGVAALDGKLYALGGRQEDERPLTDFERYDPATGSWERLTGIPEATAGFGFEVYGGRLVAAGGEDLSRRVLTGSVWAYSPESDSWTRLPSMTWPKHGFAMVEHGGRLWAFSGSRCSGFFPVRSVESWRPSA
jgi:N-acetylneuraminic acid mutarotase